MISLYKLDIRYLLEKLFVFLFNIYSDTVGSFSKGQERLEKVWEGEGLNHIQASSK